MPPKEERRRQMEQLRSSLFGEKAKPVTVAAVSVDQTNEQLAEAFLQS